MESETEEEETAASASGWFMERQSTNNALASIDPAQAVKLIKQLASDPQAGVVYIRADDSIIRYKLGYFHIARHSQMHWYKMMINFITSP